MKNIKDYELLHEASDHFKIRDKRDGREFKMAKAMLSPDLHSKLANRLGKPKKLSDGGEIEDRKDLEIEALKERIPKNPLDLEEIENSKIQKFDAGGDVQPTEDPIKIDPNTMPQVPQNAINPNVDQTLSNTSPISAVVPETVAPETVVSPRQDAPSAGPATLHQNTPSENLPDLNPRSAYEQGMQNTLSGVQAEAGAKESAGQQETVGYNQFIQDAKELQKKHQDTMSTLQKSYDESSDAVKNWKPDYNRYLGNMTTPQRITTAIGMIISGLGGNRGNENTPIAMLNNAIERDMKQQQDDLSSKQNLLRINIEKTHDENLGYQITQQQLWGLAEAKAKQAESMAKGPLAKAAAMKLTGDIQRQAGMDRQRFSVIQGLSTLRDRASQASNPSGYAEAMADQLSAVGDPKGEELRKRIVPGIGVSSIEVPNDIRQSLVAKTQLQDAAKDLLDWSSKNTGSIDPRVIAEGKQKSQLLQSLYREGILGTVYKAGEQPLLDKVVGEDPTSFFNTLSNIPKLKEIISSNDRMMNVQKKQYGLPSTTNNTQNNQVSNNPFGAKPIR